MTSPLSRRSALVMALVAAAALGGCGRRGGLELPGETPSPIGGPTPPNLPPRAAVAPTDPTAVPPREPGAQPQQQRRDYDRNRPVGRGQILPSGRFILDPLL